MSTDQLKMVEEPMPHKTSCILNIPQTRDNEFQCAKCDKEHSVLQCSSYQMWQWVNTIKCLWKIWQYMSLYSNTWRNTACQENKKLLKTLTAAMLYFTDLKEKTFHVPVSHVLLYYHIVMFRGPKTVS